MTVPINNNADNSFYDVTDDPKAETSDFEPGDIPMNKTRSDWSAIQGESPLAIEAMRRGMNQGAINPPDGDSIAIDPDSPDVQTGTDEQVPIIGERELSRLRDSGLQDKVGGEGIRFEAFNRGREGLMIADLETTDKYK